MGERPDLSVDLRSGRAHRPDPLLPVPGFLVARGLIYTIVALLLALATWACFAEVDVVVDAPGRLLVQGREIRITAPEAALVVEVRVSIGDRVREGDLLLRLDAYQHETAIQRLDAEARVLELEVERHRENAALVLEGRPAVERELEATRWIARKIAAQLEHRRGLYEDGVVSEAQRDEKELELKELEVRIAQIESKLGELHHSARVSERTAAETEERIESLQLRRTQLREHVKRASIVAPCDAIVTELSVLHPGSVISTEQPAVLLVPVEQPLLACVQLANASMRQLRVGLDVHLEIEAFPREEFGLIEGELSAIEPSADERGNYVAWVSLLSGEGDSDLMRRLQPGLLAKAQILVERRTLVDFLIKPLQRLRGGIAVQE